jgi:uncharacterized membrane protein (UPF0127 family)
MRHPIPLALTAVLILAPAVCTEATPSVIPLKLPSGKALQVEVMATNADREMGLMFRRSLPEDRGMLFVFDEPGNYGFWMKNCRFPIDMVWLDDKRRVVYIAEKVPPCKNDPCPSYGGLQRALYVLELGAGQARREKTAMGSVVDFDPHAATPAPPQP